MKIFNRADKKTLIIFIVALVVAGLGCYYFGFQKGFGVGYQGGYSEGKEIGAAAAKTSPEAAVTNPLEKMPEVNPFEKVLNPFKELYRNPFK